MSDVSKIIQNTFLFPTLKVNDKFLPVTTTVASPTTTATTTPAAMATVPAPDLIIDEIEGPIQILADNFSVRVVEDLYRQALVNLSSASEKVVVANNTAQQSSSGILYFFRLDYKYKTHKA